MPDWTYQTVFRPILRRLPYGTAQSLAFGAMGQLGRNPVGRAVVSILGHAAPPKDVTVSRTGVHLPAPVALGSGVDLSARAVSTTCLFGFGLVEVGPVDLTGSDGRDAEVTTWDDVGLRIPTRTNVPVDKLVASLKKNRFRGDTKIVVRLQVNEAANESDVTAVVGRLAELVDGFSIQSINVDSALDLADRYSSVLQSFGKLVLAVVPTSQLSDQSSQTANLLADGLIVTAFDHENGCRGGLDASVVEEVAIAAATVRKDLPDKWVIAHGGVREPADANCLLNAGVDVVMIDSGFAESGPGLPKRINTLAAAHRRAEQRRETFDEKDRYSTAAVPIPHRSWFWSFLLGLSLLIGGVMAFVIGVTQVVLPYDEEFLSMAREEICAINPQLLPFMSHDRVTLAGTMLALGPMYLALAWFGDRRGMHWARVAVLASSFVGFLSFFLFLGFGYFDPFHAFISAILFQLMALGLRSSQSAECGETLDLYNSMSWKRALWGQLLMVIQGAAILTAGIVISSFGVTTVFVAEDLDFMNTTRNALVDANARLVPLVAHDRASFGGMLMATGVTVLLSSLWGWHRGRRWLWWSLLLSGSVAYGTTIFIHWHVGYTSLIHLLPAYGGLLFLWLAMLLSRDWLFEECLSADSDQNLPFEERAERNSAQ